MCLMLRADATGVCLGGKKKDKGDCAITTNTILDVKSLQISVFCLEQGHTAARGLHVALCLSVQLFGNVHLFLRL